MFYAPADKLDRLSRQATRLISRATRNARWPPVRELQSLARQAQYLFLAIPAQNSSCGSSTPWSGTGGAGASGRRHSSAATYIGGHRLKAQEFWSSGDERQHIIWKELKTVRLAVESFLPHLAGHNFLMHEDNQRAGSAPHSIDRFASALNTLLPRYNVAWLGPTCKAVDSLHLPDADWRRDNNW
eukprot:jgi/Tetstr1/438982/TSEL_027474.t1